MWSTSQPRAGRVHHGNTHVRSRRIDLFADAVRDLVRRGGELGVEVDDGLDGDLRPGVAAPGLELVEQDQPLALFHSAGGAEDGLIADGGRVEVGVEDDLAGGRQVVVIGWAGDALGKQFEGGLGAGEVAECLGAADVEGLGRAEGLQRRGAVGERPVEVEGVGEVELGLEPHRPGEVDVLVMDRGVARIDREVAVLGIGRRIGSGELERLMVSATSRSSCAVPILPATAATCESIQRCCLDRERGRGVDGGLGHQPRPPRGTRPAWTCAQSRGRRCRSSRA